MLEMAPGGPSGIGAKDDSQSCHSTAPAGGRLSASAMP